MQTYATKKKSAAPSPAGVKAAENISKSDMLHISGAGAPQPMSAALREKFEPSFGADFSNIRISRGHIPDAMGVQAVAKGTDILVDSRAGMDVLGHELAHVVQQAQGRVSSGGFPVVHNAGLEHEADVMGARAASGLSAMQGGISGFGGEAMQIAPMSDASAPAQCKSKTEKKMDKARERYDKNFSADQDKAKKAYSAEMRKIVQGMSEEELHDPKIQQKFVNIAGQAANASLGKLKNNSTWENFATVLRGSDSQAEQAGMNEMMIRLLGGRNAIRSTVKGEGSDQDILTNVSNQIEGNDEVMNMLGNFTNQTFNGINAAAVNNDASRDMAVMNNFMTRVISGAVVPTREETAAGVSNDTAAIKRALKIQALPKADSNTGELLNNTEAVRNFASLPSRAVQRANAANAQPAPQKKKGFFSRLFGR